MGLLFLTKVEIKNLCIERISRETGFTINRKKEGHVKNAFVCPVRQHWFEFVIRTRFTNASKKETDKINCQFICLCLILFKKQT